MPPAPCPNGDRARGRASGRSSAACPRRRTGSSHCSSRCRRPWCARCAGGPRGSACTSCSRPTSRSRRRTRRSGSRSPSVGSHPTAAARGCCRAGSARRAHVRCCCSGRPCTAPKRPNGAWSTRQWIPPTSTPRSAAVVEKLATGPDRRPRPHEVVAPRERVGIARRPLARRGVRDGAVVTLGRLP